MPVKSKKKEEKVNIKINSGRVLATLFSFCFLFGIYELIGFEVAVLLGVSILVASDNN